MWQGSFVYMYFAFSLYPHFIFSVCVAVWTVRYKTGLDISYEIILHSSRMKSFFKICFLIFCLVRCSFTIFKTIRKQIVYKTKTHKTYMAILRFPCGIDIQSELREITNNEDTVSNSICNINVSWMLLFSSNKIFCAFDKFFMAFSFWSLYGMVKERIIKKRIRKPAINTTFPITKQKYIYNTKKGCCR